MITKISKYLALTFVLLALCIVPATAQGIPSGPCQNNTLSGSPVFVSVGSVVYGCPAGVGQVWTQIWPVTSQSTPTGLGIGASQLASVNLTAAQINGMFTTPITVIAAPGAGLAISVDKVTLEMNPSGTAFASGGVVNINYHGGAAAVNSTVPAATVTAAGTTQTLTTLGPLNATNGTVVPANTGIDVTNATGAFTTGTGTAKLLIEYRVLTL